MAKNDTRKPLRASTSGVENPADTPLDGKSARPDAGIKRAFVPLTFYEDRRLKLTHHRVMGVILSYHNPRNPQRGCWPSQEKIARHLGISSKNVSDTVRSLAALGYLEVRKKGRKNYYYIPEYMNEKGTATTGVSCNSTVAAGVSVPEYHGNSTVTTVVSTRNSTVTTGVEHTTEVEQTTEIRDIDQNPKTPDFDRDLDLPDFDPVLDPDFEPVSAVEPHPADDAWASIAEPYDPTPAEPEPAPAHTRRARSVPETRGVTKTRQATLPLLLEEESSDSPPNPTEPKAKPKRHTYNGPRAERFLDFWAVWSKKAAKFEACKVWKSQGLDAMADEIIADVEQRQARHGEWLRGFQPNPDRYLRNRRWEDEIIEAETGGNRHDRQNAAKRIQCDAFSAFGNEEAETAAQSGPGVVLTGNFGGD